MQIQKRTLPMYIFLNCITLGIYGFVVANQMNREIDAICKGDGQRPRFGYVATVFLSLIPVFGPIYYTYWWYQQANRLQMNAGRYGIKIKENGTEIFLMRTVLEAPLVVVTFIEIVVAMLIPGLITLLFTWIHPVMGIIFGIIFGLILAIFRNELTAGANISNYYMMKNLNRMADVYRNGALPFDPMGYEYYPSFENNYVNREHETCSKVEDNSRKKADDNGKSVEVDTVIKTSGQLIGVKGACAGYAFELVSGEEVILGKDAKMSSVVIDPAYKEISRKHVSICYDMTTDQYRVTDFSSNGTWANGEKLTNGQSVYLCRGTELKLANDKNIFRLG